MMKLRHLHDGHSKVFEKDYEKEEEEIDILTLEIKNKFQKITEEINKISTEEINSQTDQFKHNIKLSLINDVNELAKQFRDDQRNYIQKLKIIKDRKKNLTFMRKIKV